MYSFYFGNYTAIRLLRLYKSLPALRLHPAIHVMTKAFSISLSTALTLGGRVSTGGNMSITTVPSVRVFTIPPKQGEKAAKRQTAVLSTRSDYIGSSHSNVVSSRRNSSGPCQFAACIALPILAVFVFFVSLVCTQIWVSDVSNNAFVESALNSSASAFHNDPFVFNDMYVSRSLATLTNFENVGSTIWVLLMSVLTGGTGYNGEGIMGTLNYAYRNMTSAGTPQTTLGLFAGSADTDGYVENLDLRSVEFEFKSMDAQYVGSPSASLFVTLMLSPGGVLFLTVTASLLAIMLAPVFATFAIGSLSYVLIFYAIPAVFYLFIVFVLSPFLTGVAAMSRAVRFIEEKETERRIAEQDSHAVYSAVREERLAKIRASLKTDAESCKRPAGAPKSRRSKKKSEEGKELHTVEVERRRRREYLAGLSDASIGKVAPPSSADAVRAIPECVRRCLTVEQQLQLIITFRDFYSLPGDAIARCQSKEQLMKQLNKLRSERNGNNDDSQMNDASVNHIGGVEEIMLVEKYLDYLGDFSDNADPHPASDKVEVKLAPYFAGTSATLSINNRLAFGKSLLPPVPSKSADETSIGYYDKLASKFLNAFLSSAARIPDVAKSSVTNDHPSPSSSPRRLVASRNSASGGPVNEQEAELLVTDPNGGMFIRDDVDYQGKSRFYRFKAFCTNFWTVTANTLHMVIEGYPRIVSIYLTKHMSKLNRNSRHNSTQNVGTTRDDVDPYIIALRIRESTPPTAFTWATCVLMIFNLAFLASKQASSSFYDFYNVNSDINSIGTFQGPSSEDSINRIANLAALVCVGLYTAEVLIRLTSQGWRLFFFSPPSSDAFTPSTGSRATHGAASASWINYVDIACIAAAYIEFGLSANQSCTLSAVRAAIRLVYWGKYLPDFAGSQPSIPTRGGSGASRTISYRIRHLCRSFFSALPYHLSLMLMVGILIWMWALLGAQLFNRYHMVSLNQNSFGFVPSSSTSEFSFAPRSYGSRMEHSQPPTSTFNFYGEDYYRYFPAAILASSTTLSEVSTDKIVSFDLEHFSTFLTSAFSVFQVFTGDDWSPLFYSTLAAIDSTDMYEDLSRVNESRVLRDSSVNFYESGFLAGVLYNTLASTTARSALTKFTLFATAGFYFLALLLVSHFVFMPLFFGIWWYVLVAKNEQEKEAALSLPIIGSGSNKRTFDTPLGTTEDLEELFLKRHAELEKVRTAFQRDLEDSRTQEERRKLQVSYGERFRKLVDARSSPTWNYHLLTPEEESDALQEMGGENASGDRVSWLLHNTDVDYAHEKEAFAPTNPLASLDGPRSNYFHDGKSNHSEYNRSRVRPVSGSASRELVDPSYLDPQLVAVMASAAREERNVLAGHVGTGPEDDPASMDDLFRYHEIFFSANSDKEYESLNNTADAIPRHQRPHFGSYYYAPNEEKMATYYHEVQLLMKFDRSASPIPQNAEEMKEYLQDLSREEGPAMIASQFRGSDGDEAPIMIYPKSQDVTHFPVLPCPPPQKVVTAFTNWKNSQGDFAETIQLPSYFSTLYRPGLTTRRTAEDLYEKQHKQAAVSRHQKMQLLLIVRSFIYSRIRIASLKRATMVADQGVLGDKRAEANIKAEVDVRSQPSKFLLHLIMSQLWSFGLALGVSSEQIVESITESGSNVRSWDLLLSEIENEIAAVELQVGEEQIGRGSRSVAAAPLLRDLTSRDKPLAELANESADSTQFSRTAYSLFVFSPTNKFRQAIAVVVESILFQVGILVVSAASLVILATYDVRHPFSASSPFFDRSNYPSVSGTSNSPEHFGYVSYTEAVYNNIMFHSSARKLTLDILDNVVTGVFVAEMILKFVAWGVVLCPLPITAHASLRGIIARLRANKAKAELNDGEGDEVVVNVESSKTHYISQDSSPKSADPSSLSTKLASTAPYFHSMWNLFDAGLAIISLVTIFVVPMNLRFLKVFRFPALLIRLLSSSSYVSSSLPNSGKWHTLQLETEREIHQSTWVSFFDAYKAAQSTASPLSVTVSFWSKYGIFCVSSLFRRLFSGYTHPYYNLIFTPRFETDEGAETPSGQNVEMRIRNFFCVSAPSGIRNSPCQMTESPILPYFVPQFLGAAVIQSKVVISSLKPLLIVCLLLFINYTAWSVCGVEVWKARVGECVNGQSDSTGTDNSAESCVSRTPVNTTTLANSTRASFTVAADTSLNELPQYFSVSSSSKSITFPTEWRAKERNFENFGSAIYSLWSISGGGSSGNNGWWSSLMYGGPIGGSDFPNKASWNSIAMRRRFANATLNSSSTSAQELLDMLFVSSSINGTPTDFVFDETNTSLHVIANNPYLMYHEDDKDRDKLINQTSTGFLSKLTDDRSDTTLFKGIFFVAFIAFTDFVLLKLLVVVVLSSYYSLASDREVDLSTVDEKNKVSLTLERRWASASKTLQQLYRPILVNHDAVQSGQEIDGAGAGDAAPAPLSNFVSEGFGRLFFGHLELGGKTTRFFLANGFYFAYVVVGYGILVATLVVIACTQYITLGTDGASVYGMSGAGFYVYRLFSSFLLMPWCWVEMLLRWATYGPHRCLWKSSTHTPIFPSWSSPSIGSSAPLLAGTVLPSLWISLNWLEFVVNALTLTDTLLKETSDNANQNAALKFKDSKFFAYEFPIQSDRNVFLTDRETTTVFGYYYDRPLPSTAYYPSSNGLHFDFNILRSLKIAALICVWACAFFRTEKVKPVRQAIRHVIRAVLKKNTALAYQARFIFTTVTFAIPSLFAFSVAFATPLLLCFTITGMHSFALITTTGGVRDTYSPATFISNGDAAVPTKLNPYYPPTAVLQSGTQDMMVAFEATKTSNPRAFNMGGRTLENYFYHYYYNYQNTSSVLLPYSRVLDEYRGFTNAHTAHATYNFATFWSSLLVVAQLSAPLSTFLFTSPIGAGATLGNGLGGVTGGSLLGAASSSFSGKVMMDLINGVDPACLAGKYTTFFTYNNAEVEDRSHTYNYNCGGNGLAIAAFFFFLCTLTTGLATGIVLGSVFVAYQKIAHLHELLFFTASVTNRGGNGSGTRVSKNIRHLSARQKEATLQVFCTLWGEQVKSGGNESFVTITQFLSVLHQLPAPFGLNVHPQLARGVTRINALKVLQKSFDIPLYLRDGDLCVHFHAALNCVGRSILDHNMGSIALTRPNHDGDATPGESLFYLVGGRKIATPAHHVAASCIASVVRRHIGAMVSRERRHRRHMIGLCECISRGLQDNNSSVDPQPLEQRFFGFGGSRFSEELAISEHAVASFEGRLVDYVEEFQKWRKRPDIFVEDVSRLCFVYDDENEDKAPPKIVFASRTNDGRIASLSQVAYKSMAAYCKQRDIAIPTVKYLEEVPLSRDRESPSANAAEVSDSEKEISPETHPILAKANTNTQQAAFRTMTREFALKKLFFVKDEQERNAPLAVGILPPTKSTSSSKIPTKKMFPLPLESKSEEDDAILYTRAVEKNSALQLLTSQATKNPLSRPPSSLSGQRESASLFRSHGLYYYYNNEGPTKKLENHDDQAVEQTSADEAPADASTVVVSRRSHQFTYNLPQK